MRGLLLGLLTLLLSGCAVAQPPMKDLQDTSLRLEFGWGGVCSGTAVGKDLILTATHCLDGGPLVAVNGRDAYALEAVRDGNDHIILRVNIAFSKWASMGRAPVQGQAVYWIGNPGGVADVYREGYVAKGDPCNTNQRGACIIGAGWKGDSGSGVRNSDGRVIGVISLVMVLSQTMYMIVALPLTFTADQWQEIRQ